MLVSCILFNFGCSLGYAPKVTISPSRPLVARNMAEYLDKRAVLLAVREPENERGLGKWFASVIFTEMLAAAPFASVGNQSDKVWYGLQSTESEELATAAQLGREMGYDLAVIADVERFIYGRTANSMLIVTFYVIDSTKGEIIHSRKVKAEGIIGYTPPFWDVSLNNPVHRDDLFQSVAIDFVNGLRQDWNAPEPKEKVEEYEKTQD